jgi:hypothetical protein
MAGSSMASSRPTWRSATGRKYPGLAECEDIYAKSVNYIVPRLPQSIEERCLANCVQQDLVRNKCKRDCDVKVTARSRFFSVKEGPFSDYP